jgi:hypothetical protein
MKHILTILAATVALMPLPANAQIDTDGLMEFTRQRIAPPTEAPTNPTNDSVQAIAKVREAIAKAEAKPAAIPGSPTLPAKIMLPPPMYDGPYMGGQLIVTKWNDYSLIRHICKETPLPAHTRPTTPLLVS